MTAVLAIDLGGTNMRAAQIGPDGLPGAAENGPAPKSVDEFAARIRVLLKANDAGRLGIGVPGLARGSVCTWMPNLGFLDGTDLTELFPGISIGLGNDAQLALLAEATLGAARGRRDAILLSIGTGIGSAVLSGGRIVRGSKGGACSFGWACAEIDDLGDERNGWLERHAAGRALDAAARGINLADGPALIAAAREGYAAAVRALEEPMHILGTTLAGAVGLLDPEVIVIAGGVAAEMDLLAPMVREAMNRQLPPHLRNVEIRAGMFGPKAGLIGAGIAGRQGPDWGDIHG
ncbi:MAG: ROK family protein [Devosia sp.]